MTFLRIQSIMMSQLIYFWKEAWKSFGGIEIIFWADKLFSG